MSKEKRIIEDKMNILEIDKSKKVIDLFYDSSMKSYEKLYDIRMEIRNRSINIFTIFLGILGAVVLLQGSESSFADLIKEVNLWLKLVFTISLLLGFIIFLLVYLSIKTSVLDDDYVVMKSRVKELVKDNTEIEPISLVEENMEVDVEYYIKVEFIKSYSIATNDMIKSIKIIKVYFALIYVSMIISIFTASIILLT